MRKGVVGRVKVYQEDERVAMSEFETKVLAVLEDLEKQLRLVSGDNRTAEPEEPLECTLSNQEPASEKTSGKKELQKKRWTESIRPESFMPSGMLFGDDDDFAAFSADHDVIWGTGPDNRFLDPVAMADFSGVDAFVWEAASDAFRPVTKVRTVPFDMLLGIDFQKETVLQNTLQFAKGFAANNALLWGARGMGKSSLVKAVHQKILEMSPSPATSGKDAVEKYALKLVEINREDIATLPSCLRYLQGRPERFLLYCDDLSFDGGDTSYKSLKTVLEGGLEGRPENVIFHATSNRRHLMPRDAIENETDAALHPSETVEEKISLSDRFGLWIGFHSCSQAIYLEIVAAYAQKYGLAVSGEELRAKAIEWSVTRGARSGRVAWQFIQDQAGREGIQV